MRNISFSLTTEQIKSRTKTVTRRTGWKNLRPGQELRAVEKAMGLKAGEKIKPIAVIRVLSVRQERLEALTNDAVYGFDECAKEGFADHPTLRFPSEFITFFCASHKGCAPSSEVTRIEFEYVDRLECVDQAQKRS
jgi:hypothetical protein